MELNKVFLFHLYPGPSNALLRTPTTARIVIIDDESAGMPGSVDRSFQSGILQITDSGAVPAMAFLPDGKIVAAVALPIYPYQFRIVRLLPDGAFDRELVSTTFGHVTSIMVHTNSGDIYVGGAFSDVNGVLVANLMRILPNGTVDPHFSPVFNDKVNFVGLRSTNSILVAGDFTHVTGELRAGIAAVTFDGLLDTNFVPPHIDSIQGSTNGSPADINRLVIQPDGKIVFAGQFDRIDTSIRTNIARLNSDGSFDSTFNANWHRYNSVFGLALQPDGKLVVGGYIAVNPQECCQFPEGIVRLLPNGQLDPGFALAQVPNYVTSLLLQPDGRIVVNGIHRIETNGLLDTSFVTGFYYYSLPYALLWQPENKILVASGFERVNELPTAGIVRLFAGALPTNGPGQIDFVTSGTNVSESATNLIVTVRRLYGATGPERIDYATSDYTALAGRDYIATSGNIIFHDQETQKTISIPIINNNFSDWDRSFYIRLTHPVGQALIGYNSRLTVGIIEDDPGIWLSASQVPLEKSGLTSLAVMRKGPLGGTSSVDVILTGITAAPGTDYSVTTTNIQFLPGELSKAFRFNLIDDSIPEPDETINATLTNPVGAVLADPSSIEVTILDDDRPLSFHPEATSVHSIGGVIEFTVDSPPGNLVYVQRSTNLVDWQTIHILWRNPSDPPVTLRETIGDQPGSFFLRAYLPPP